MLYKSNNSTQSISIPDAGSNTSSLCNHKESDANSNANESLCLSVKDGRCRRSLVYNSHRLNSSSCIYSEAVKQTTCTTTTTSSNVVYKCRQCNRLFVSLISVQEHRLAVHVVRSDLIGCGLCGVMYETEHKAKSCFYQHK